jgi:2-polyprenyl-3-methyl-5-hydroxy-6-metoxy-1,4-benzoquinol methylase
MKQQRVKKTVEPIMDLGDIAFYWRIRQRRGDFNFAPDFLPFSFIFHTRLQLLSQKTNAHVLNCLNQVYLEDNNVGYLQDGHALAELYGSDFLLFIEEMIQNREPSPRSLLEIGCGGGYLLKKLDGHGYSVEGVDPSPVAVRRGREIGVRVTAGFYPDQKPSGKMDVIYHYDVLEHVEDPVFFLNAHRDDLNPGGIIIVAVPDCTEQINRGDISMVLHEHINYFDAESLRLTLQEAGFVVLTVQPAKGCGVLYGVAELAAKIEGEEKKKGRDNRKFDRFASRAGRLTEAFREYLSPLLADEKKSVGIYVPLRMTPYLSLLKIFSGLRFFDDDPGLHGKYFDGFDVPIENMEDLIQRPVTNLLIASYSFGDLIAEKIKARNSGPIEIKLLGDVV